MAVPSTFINLLIGFFTGIASGATIIIAQYFGAREYAMVRKTTHTALVLAALIGICFTMIGLLASNAILHLLQTPADIFDMSVKYLRIYFLGMIPSIVYNMGSGILRAVGDTKRPVYILIATAIINIFLDLLFTAALQMGVQGAALATILSRLLPAPSFYYVCTLRRTPLSQLHFRELKPDRRILLHITRIGLPTGLQSTMFDMSNLLIQASVNFFGTAVIAGWTAYGNINLIFWMTISAMGTTIATFTGQNFGAGNLDLMRQGLRTSMILCSIGCVLLSVVTILLRYPLAHLCERPRSR